MPFDWRVAAHIASTGASNGASGYLYFNWISVEKQHAVGLRLCLYLLRAIARIYTRTSSGRWTEATAACIKKVQPKDEVCCRDGDLIMISFYDRCSTSRETSRTGFSYFFIGGRRWTEERSRKCSAVKDESGVYMYNIQTLRLLCWCVYMYRDGEGHCCDREGITARMHTDAFNSERA